MKRLLVVLAATLLSACTSQAPAPANQEPAATSSTIPVTTKSQEALARFKEGEALLDNIRFSEAAAKFSEAMKLDPDFVLARAYHGAAGRVAAPAGTGRFRRLAVGAALRLQPLGRDQGGGRGVAIALLAGLGAAAATERSGLAQADYLRRSPSRPC